jgi:hypothetical protein
MKKICISSALALALGTTSLAAAPIHGHAPLNGIDTASDQQVWLADAKGKGKAKGNAKVKKKQVKANGNAGKAKGKPEQAAQKANGNAGKAKDKPEQAAQKSNGNAGKAKGKPEQAVQKSNGNAGNAKGNADIASNGKNKNMRVKAFTPDERENAVTRLLSTSAPDGRDMTRVLAATGLALATPQLVIADTPQDQLISYANCPPGLAKKNPPCVPPGLARDGISYEDWVSYDRDRYDSLWIDRRDTWLGSGYDVDPNPDYLLLQSDQIASLYNLSPAPGGQRYGLIDGMPVLLDDDDYTSLMVVNQLAQVPNLGGVPIAPTAALTQDELISLYRLPQPGPDQSYAVLNGQLVQLDNSEYDLLQMLRVARAVL